jgi:hypothetical protein
LSDDLFSAGRGRPAMGSGQPPGLIGRWHRSARNTSMERKIRVNLRALDAAWRDPPGALRTRPVGLRCRRAASPAPCRVAASLLGGCAAGSAGHGASPVIRWSVNCIPGADAVVAAIAAAERSRDKAHAHKGDAQGRLAG